VSAEAHNNNISQKVNEREEKRRGRWKERKNIVTTLNLSHEGELEKLSHDMTPFRGVERAVCDFSRSKASTCDVSHG
jgi:hypothetical protein